MEKHFDTNPHSTPQTTDYLVEFCFHGKDTETRRYHSIEGIQRDVHKEKNRRKIDDRAWRVRYQNKLTPHGIAYYKERYNASNEMVLSGILGITLGEWMDW